MIPETKKENVYFVTLDEINRPVYMLGFKPLHLGMLFFSLIIIAIVSIASFPVTGSLIIISIGFMLVIKIGSTIAKENNKGNPDFIDAQAIYGKIPKSVDDSIGVFSELLSGDERS